MILGPVLLACVTALPPGHNLPASPDAFIAAGGTGDVPVGRLVRVTADGTATLATPNGNVEVPDLVALYRAAVALPPHPRGPVLVTTTGDRIPGRLLGGDAQVLRFRPAFTETVWEVPIAVAAVLWLTDPPADTPPDPDRYPWLADRPKRDVLRFRNGDFAAGTLDGFSADGAAIRFKPESGSARSVPLAALAAVAFNPNLATARRPKGPYAHLVLRDGTRLDVTGASADGTTLRAKTLFGSAAEIPLADLVSLAVFRGKAVYLSHLKPKAATAAGFLGPAWPWTADRSVRGAPLRLLTSRGEETFDRGLGTHPRTVLTYDLAAKYRRFEALVGLDPVSGGRGRAVVRVLVDGKEQDLPGLPDLAAGRAVPVRVGVTGAKELTLVVDFGPAGDVQADVNWADARLVE